MMIIQLQKDSEYVIFRSLGPNMFRRTAKLNVLLFCYSEAGKFKLGS